MSKMPQNDGQHEMKWEKKKKGKEKKKDNGPMHQSLPIVTTGIMVLVRSSRQKENSKRRAQGTLSVKLTV